MSWLKDDLTLYDPQTHTQVFRMDVIDGKTIAHNDVKFDGDTVMKNATVTGDITLQNATVTGHTIMQNATVTGNTTLQNATINGDVYIYSDDRVKHNEQPITNAIEMISNLYAVSYNKYTYNVDEDVANGNQPDDMKFIGVENGFIAQEIISKVPELTHLVKTPDDDESFYSVNYIGLIAPLVKCVQELNEKIIVLEQKCQLTQGLPIQ